MTNPRQLAPTVGLSHDGLTILEGKLKGLKGYVVGRMTKSRRGKLYIDDAGWGPDAGSIEYGYRVPFNDRYCDGSTTKSLHEDICRGNSTTGILYLSPEDMQEAKKSM